ncbi:MAG: ABC transporter permease [Clostridia bacterium]|nr:ABC transporter permease [Clostridia bacterium]
MDSARVIQIEVGDLEEVGSAGLSDNSRRRLLSVASPIALIIIWEMLVRVHLLDSRFFPAPSAVAVSFYHMVASGTLFSDLWVSMIRIMGGFLLGAVPGLLIGLTMGLFPLVRAALEPMVAATYPIPKLALMPLIMLIFGLGELEKMVVIALGAFFLVLINTVAGVVNLDKIYLDVAKNYGATRKDYYLTVALPGALPMIFTGMKLAMGMALLLIVAAEMMGATAGIGYRIWESYAIFDIPEMFVSFVVMSILGFLFTIGLDEIEQWVVPWKQN